MTSDKLSLVQRDCGLESLLVQNTLLLMVGLPPHKASSSRQTRKCSPGKQRGDAREKKRRSSIRHNEEEDHVSEPAWAGSLLFFFWHNYDGALARRLPLPFSALDTR